MAGLKAHFSSSVITAATSSGWKPLLQITAPANHRVFITGWGVYCRGTVNSDKPIKARLIRASAAGTGVTSLTAGKQNTSFSETVQTTGVSATFSGAPTSTGQPLDEKFIHPQSRMQAPAYERDTYVLAGGEIAIIEYDNDGGGASVPIFADVTIEE